MRSRNRYITCKRGDMAVSFGEQPESPYFLTDADGLYEAEVDVSVSENTFDDGGIYQSSRIKKRNIVLTIQDRGTDDHIAVRDALLNLFLPKNRGRLTIKENDGDSESEKVIDYYTEKVISDGKNSSRTFTISLICPDPYFYDPYDKCVQMANYAAMFTFQHSFLSAGEEFGSRSKTKSKNLRNITGADAIGLTIDFGINGAVTNPSVTRVESGETIKIGTDTKPLSLVYGDVLTVTTGNGNKHVYLTRSGARKEINQYLSADSSFFELHQGSNTIGYDAEIGVSNIEVTVSYRMRYTHA